MAALGFAGALQSQLYGTSARDPLTLAAVTGLLIGVGFLACLLPAIPCGAYVESGATRIDSLRALQSE